MYLCTTITQKLFVYNEKWLHAQLSAPCLTFPLTKYASILKNMI